MACRGCLECLLKLLNFLMTLAGLAMVGYGIYLFVEYKNAADTAMLLSPVGSDQDLIQFRRPMLMAVSLSSSIFDNLPKAWYGFSTFPSCLVLCFLIILACMPRLSAQCGSVEIVYIFIYWSRGGSLCYLLFWLYWSCNTEFMLLDLCILISCLMYSVLVILLILVELGCAAFIFFDKNWKDELPTDKTGDFDMIYDFLEENWTIIKWAALGIVILEAAIVWVVNTTDLDESNLNLQALIFVLALLVRAANRPADYDSDDEFIAPRPQIRQPLINRPPAPAAVCSNMCFQLDVNQYGLDTSEFTYNPSESNRYQPVAPQPAEERSRCTIM
ncbi:hypothetical protein Golob_013579 [Gossypium lobatum]|uniref:Tobamovirus multiplication protein 2A n=2 Tax=Gossypium TaxID=3633 RepID=A0A7J8LQ10_9ROSI|nr:hypothetical protein [Gossypium lobatum]